MVAGDNNSAMASGFSLGRMNPSEVLNLAGEFVIQYYTMMRKCPSGLHRFYKDDSAMIRENDTAFGQKMIHEKIMSMNIGNSRVGILRLDALRANGNSVLIQVSGEVSFADSEFRRFMQSFVLYEQTPYDFYVLNDIFRFQDHVYGDVKLESVNTETETVSNLSNAPVDFSPGGAQKSLSTNGDAEVSVPSWENPVQQDATYNKRSTTPVDSTNAPHKEELESHEEETPSHEQGAQPPPSPVAQRTMPSAPSVVDPAQNAPQQPRSWAQMASKQPSHPVINMQSGKTLRASIPASTVQTFDDQGKGARVPVNQANAAMHPRRGGGGGGGGRQADGRIASGDHGVPQESRPMGQGPPGRMSAGRGGPMGPNMRGGGGRGGRGGMGPAGGFGGRGAGASMPKRTL